MRIYLDESKRLGEWKIVFGWFITNHSHSYVEKFIHNKKEEYKIKSSLELKWSKIWWKYFYWNMIKDNDFSILSKSIIWINIDWYSKDNIEDYKKIILSLLKEIRSIKNYKSNIFLVVDIIKFSKNLRKTEKEIELFLNNNLDIYWKIIFNFVDSKKYLWVQLSDLISYKLWKFHFFWEELDDFILNNSFNIDINSKKQL